MRRSLFVLAAMIVPLWAPLAGAEEASFDCLQGRTARSSG